MILLLLLLLLLLLWLLWFFSLLPDFHLELRGLLGLVQRCLLSGHAQSGGRGRELLELPARATLQGVPRWHHEHGNDAARDDVERLQKQSYFTWEPQQCHYGSRRPCFESRSIWRHRQQGQFCRRLRKRTHLARARGPHQRRTAQFLLVKWHDVFLSNFLEIIFCCCYFLILNFNSALIYYFTITSIYSRRIRHWINVNVSF